tara:strand:+ start:183 stop:557 length:375 start_codon:yes stop_codon:yes gene_type:complete
VLALGLVIALTGVALPVIQLIDHTLLSALWGTPASGSNPIVPFSGNGFHAYLQQHHVKQPIWIAPATNAALIAVLALLTLVIPGLKAIQKDPAKRFASASAMTDELRRITSRSGTQQEIRKEHS